MPPPAAPAETIRPRAFETPAADARPTPPGARIRGAEAPGARRPGAKKPGAKAKFAEIALVCRKCAKRQRLGKRAVRALLTAAGRLKAGGKLRVVETGCLGPCPKRALAVATGASVAAGRILLVDPAASPAALAAQLPDFGPNAALPPGPDAAGAPERRPPALRALEA